MPFKRQDLYFWLSLLFAIWFALTASFWVYYANMIVSFPFGVLSFLLWNSGRKRDPKGKRYQIIAGILIAGLVVSLVVLGLLLWKG